MFDPKGCADRAAPDDTLADMLAYVRTQAAADVVAPRDKMAPAEAMSYDAETGVYAEADLGLGVDLDRMARGRKGGDDVRFV